MVLSNSQSCKRAHVIRLRRHPHRSLQIQPRQSLELNSKSILITQSEIFPQSKAVRPDDDKIPSNTTTRTIHVTHSSLFKNRNVNGESFSPRSAIVSRTPKQSFLFPAHTNSHYDHDQVFNEHKKQKKPKKLRTYCRACTPFRVILCTLAGLLLAIVITSILLAVLIKKTSPITSAVTSTLSTTSLTTSAGTPTSSTTSTDTTMTSTTSTGTTTTWITSADTTTSSTTSKATTTTSTTSTATTTSSTTSVATTTTSTTSTGTTTSLTTSTGTTTSSTTSVATTTTSTTSTDTTTSSTTSTGTTTSSTTSVATTTTSTTSTDTTTSSTTSTGTTTSSTTSIATTTTSTTSTATTTSSTTSTATTTSSTTSTGTTTTSTTPTASTTSSTTSIATTTTSTTSTSTTSTATTTSSTTSTGTTTTSTTPTASTTSSTTSIATTTTTSTTSTSTTSTATTTSSTTSTATTTTSTTPTASTTSSTTSIATTTTSTTSTATTTSSTTTTTTWTTSTATTTSSTTTTTTWTTSTATTTISTTSITTTTACTCGCSCLNRTWISSSGLLAKWTFDGIFLEQTNTYNATAVNSPSFITNGYVNQALLLSAASSQYLYTSYIPLINASFTIEVWLYPTGFPNPTDHSILGLCTNRSNDQCLYLTIRNFAGAYRLYMSFFGDSCASNVSVSANQWIHAAFAFDLVSLNMSIYQNGVFAGVCTSALPLQGTVNNVTIGYIPGIVATYGTNFFQGYLDQLTIVNRTKSSCEILDDATLATYYNFDTNPLVSDAGPNSLSSVSQNVSFVSSGHLSDAISFNDNASYFQVKGLRGLGITNKPFSISLWIRPYSLAGAVVFVENGTAVSLWCISFLGFASNGSLVAQMWTGAMRSIYSPALLTLSVWHHIVETWSSTNGLRLYVDNTLVVTDTSALTYSASSIVNNVKLANRQSNSCTIGAITAPFPYHGDIDDFRVYSRELTVDDVCALYHY